VRFAALPRRLVHAAAATALAGAVAVAAPASAADTTGNYAVRGLGTTTCNQFSTAVDGNTGDLRPYVSWLEGAVTTANRLTPGVFDTVPFNAPGAVAALVLRQCRQQPNMLFDAAVRTTMESLQRARVTTNSPWIEMTVGSNRVTLRAETLAAVQSRLGQLGLLATPPDGRFSMATREALKRFQQIRRLPLTELPDPDTVVALLIQQ
jgi:peptidoglycan hydrolase-like protein with peptidoglycan-binding domain